MANMLLCSACRPGAEHGIPLGANLRSKPPSAKTIYLHQIHRGPQVIMLLIVALQFGWDGSGKKH